MDKVTSVTPLSSSPQTTKHLWHTYNEEDGSSAQSGPAHKVWHLSDGDVESQRLYAEIAVLGEQDNVPPEATRLPGVDDGLRVDGRGAGVALAEAERRSKDPVVVTLVLARAAVLLVREGSRRHHRASSGDALDRGRPTSTPHEGQSGAGSLGHLPNVIRRQLSLGPAAGQTFQLL